MPDATGTPESKPVAELVTPEPEGLKKLGITFAKGVALGILAVSTQFVTDHAVEIGLAVKGATQSLPPYVAALIGAAFGFGVDYLRKYNASVQKGKVLDALVTEPPADMKKYY